MIARSLVTEESLTSPSPILWQALEIMHSMNVKIWKPSQLQLQLPPKVGKRNFSTMSYRTVVVKVPQGSLAAYQSADFWQSFWNIEEFGSNSIESVEMNTNNDTTPIYTLQGVQMKDAKENLPAGIYIQSGKKFVVK